jgi:phosphoadenosine phosphosulfate reductase
MSSAAGVVDHLRVRFGLELQRVDATTTDEQLHALSIDAAHALSEARAIDVLHWAALTFGDDLVVTSSMADGLVTHLAGRAKPGVDVVFLDTGLHFPETLGMRDAVAATLPVTVITVQPTLTLLDQQKQYGPALWERDPDTCCALRKVSLLDTALRPYRAWVTGLRGDETATRVGLPVVQWDQRRRKVKINPIVRWTPAEVAEYSERHGVLANPLTQIGYTSIGCQPCTRPVAAGEHPRAGRWAGTSKTECGMHT